MTTTKIDQVLFDMRSDPPAVRIGFTTQASERAVKTPGTLRLDDGSALLVPGLLDAVNKAVADAAKGIAEPGAVAARIQAAQEAQETAKAARIAQAEAEAKAKDLDKQIAAKLAELNELQAAIDEKTQDVAVSAVAPSKAAKPAKPDANPLKNL